MRKATDSRELLMVDCVTPDGHTVDVNGALVE